MFGRRPSNEEPIQPIRLGIWGPRNSGKTVYMTMLYHYLEGNKNSPWKVHMNDPKTIDFITSNLSMIMDKGQFMPPTEIRRNKFEAYSYKLKRRDGLPRDIELKFFDLPGGFFEDNNFRIQDEELGELSVVQYLNQCHGIIFLLSPLTEDISLLQKSYRDLLRGLFVNMQADCGLQELEQYVAFCITKVDHPEVYQKFCKSSAEKSIIDVLGINTSLTWFQNYFHLELNPRAGRVLDREPSEANRCQFFYISPFGVSNGRSPIVADDTTENPKPSQDPIFQNQNQDPYAVGIPLYDTETDSKTYSIDTEVPFSPINFLAPIQWLIQGINRHPPKLKVITKENKENKINEK